MKKINCTVAILTLNSEKTLDRCLKSVKDFSEIIICDGNSTDKTLEIARSYDCKIISQHKTKKKNVRIKHYAKVRNKTINEATFDWYFYIDSDNYASPELVKSIENVVSSKKPRHLIWQAKHLIRIGEKLIKYSASYPDMRTVLFHKKTKARFIKPVHERLVFDNKYSLGSLDGHINICWSKERVDRDYWRKADKHLRLDYQRIKDQPIEDYLKWTVWFNLKNMARYIIKPLFIYARYSFDESMPFKIEYYRFLYHAKLLVRVTFYKLSKII